MKQLYVVGAWIRLLVTFKIIVIGSHNSSLKVLNIMPVRLFKFAFYYVEFGDEQYP
jgi:hypothetical protein